MADIKGKRTHGGDMEDEQEEGSGKLRERIR